MAIVINFEKTSTVHGKW